MSTPKYTIDELRQLISPIAQKYGVSGIYLFGSYARGDYNEMSDIDLRVDKGNLKGAFALCGLYTELENLLQTKIDLLTTGSLDDKFLNRIKSEEVLIYAG